MGDAWYPGAIQDPGVAAGYAHGRAQMVSCVAHFTVGRSSAGIGHNQGLFQFLVGRDGTVTQFAEADAVCWHAGQPYNQRGPGIEVEYLPGEDDAIFTPEALTACGALVRWLGTEWGIPLAYYDDPSQRVADWAGFISHRAVVSDADHHFDYWPADDFAAMTAIPEEDDMGKGTFVKTATDDHVYVFADGVRRHIPTKDLADLMAACGQTYNNFGNITILTDAQLAAIPERPL